MSKTNLKVINYSWNKYSYYNKIEKNVFKETFKSKSISNGEERGKDDLKRNSFSKESCAYPNKIK